MKKMFFAAALMWGDIITSGDGATGGGVPSDGLCVQPPNGHPKYNRVVLDTLHGEGKITASEYNRVKAGTLSIEDLSITTAELSRLRCGADSSGSYDEHSDPDLNPTISSLQGTVNVSFASGQTETDRSHRMKIETTSASIGTGAAVARVHFAREYEDEGGVVPPVVMLQCDDNNYVFSAGNITSESYDIFARSSLPATTTITVSAVVTPVRRK